jgi:hypothetical protein
MSRKVAPSGISQDVNVIRIKSQAKMELIALILSFTTIYI